MNETIFLKSGVETNSTIKLTDYPVKQGEIEYYISKLIENGTTNKVVEFITITDNVTYKGQQLKKGQRVVITIENGKIKV